MIIALYGPSSTGKTTIADTLGHELGICPTRHCGEVVKARARELHVSLNCLPVKEHREIDQETRRWVEMQSGLAIVEGRYLHWVLGRVGVGLRLVEVISDEAARECRWAMRIGRALSLYELNARDAADRDFASNMYYDLSPLSPGLTVDTSLLDVDDCVRKILKWLD